MIFETVSTVGFGTLAAYGYLKQNTETSDHAKITRIAKNSGLYIKEKDRKGNEKKIEIRLYRKTKHKDYTEYVYKLPLGLSFDDFIKKKQRFEDGVNHKKKVFDLTRKDVLEVFKSSDPFKKIKEKLKEKQELRKEIEMSYDGMLRVRIYNQPFTSYVPFHEKMLKRCKDWEIPLGETREKFLTHDMTSGHLIIAGATRFGKTVALKNIITSLIAKHPDDVVFHLIDLKGGLSFSRFMHTKQVHQLGKNVDEALIILREIHQRIQKRQKEFLEKGYEDIKESGLKTREFIVIDESAELASSLIKDKEEKGKYIECERYMSEIARIAAGLGIFLVTATQYPTSDILNRQVKINSTTKICYRLETSIASQVVLDVEGAEKITKKGRAIYKTPEGIKIVQTPFIENDQIQKIIEPYIASRPGKEEKVNEKNKQPTRRENRSNSFVIEET